LINDTSIIESEAISAQGRSIKVERRRGLIGDHIIDISARAYAVSIRINGVDGASAEPVMAIESARALVKVTQ